LGSIDHSVSAVGAIAYSLVASAFSSSWVREPLTSSRAVRAMATCLVLPADRLEDSVALTCCRWRRVPCRDRGVFAFLGVMKGFSEQIAGGIRIVVVVSNAEDTVTIFSSGLAALGLS